MTHYTNFDAFLDEVDSNESPEKGFALGEEQFTLPAVLPAKLILKMSRLGDSPQDAVRGMDLALQTLLGDEQYERILDLVPDGEKLVILAGKIMGLYQENKPSPNARKVQKRSK